MKKAALSDLNRLSVEAFKQAPKTPVSLVLDNVRSALNVGSAFRTADAFALERIYLCGITCQPPHREIHKTALGATGSVDWEYAPHIQDLIRRLKAEGWLVLAVEQAAGSLPLQEFVFPAGQKIALVFGNEVHGVGDEAMDLVDGALEVPQFGVKHSLNVSVCVGVVVWELFCKWKFNR
ncbi:MAG: TrmH family RNA methyltransferase [Haliscomenobacter sp.]|nr:TrmH family RNA methyltransferase [Haliscomenobacter sp.]